jgi:hypothetical protein
LLSATDEAGLTRQAERLTAIRNQPRNQEPYPRSPEAQAAAAAEADELVNALTGALNRSMADKLGIAPDSPAPDALRGDQLERALTNYLNR